MKKIILFILLLIPTLAISQGNYYWSHNGKGNCSLRSIENILLSQVDGTSFSTAHKVSNPTTYCPLIIETGLVFTTNSSIYPSLEYNTNRFVMGGGINTFDMGFNEVLISGFTPNTVYYVRYYVINGAGVNYSERLITQTLGGVSVPTSILDYAYATSNTTAFFQGYAINNGGGTISDKGFCWKLNNGTPPTKNDNYVSVSSGNGTYTYNKTGLTAGATYGVTAYATNEAGTAYSSMLTMTMNVTTTPTVSTTSPTTITSNSAISGGNVTSDGGVSVVNRGLEYTTDPSFTSGIFSVPGGSGTGSFTSYITGLSPSTTYYVRAFASNSIGTSYGAVYSFTTNAECILPSFIAASCGNITASSIDATATISSDGGCTVTSRGFQYSTDASFNTVLGSVTASGTGIGQYSATISGLTCGVHYYFMPWATNSIGTYYATSLVGTGCTTEPTTTPTAGSITFPNYPINPVQITAYFSNQGCDLLERGIVWNTTGNPTVNDNKYVSSSNAEGTQSYSISMAAGTYYFASYARNAKGITYMQYPFALTIP